MRTPHISTPGLVLYAVPMAAIMSIDDKVIHHQPHLIRRVTSDLHADTVAKLVVSPLCQAINMGPIPGDKFQSFISLILLDQKWKI